MVASSVMVASLHSAKRCVAATYDAVWKPVLVNEPMQ